MNGNMEEQSATILNENDATMEMAYATSASDPRGWEYNDEGSYLNGTYPVSNEPRTHFRSMMEKATVYQLDGEGKSCLEVAGLLLPTANDTEKNMLANEVMNGYNSYVRGKATRGSEEVSEQFNNGSTALSKKPRAVQTRKSSGFKIAGGTRKLTKRYPADMERHLVHLKENEHLSHRAIVERLYPNLPFSPAKVSQVRDRYWAYTQHMAKLAANAPVHDEKSGFVDGESASLSVMGVESEIGNDKESEQQLDDEQIFSWMK